jgi:hypothetical protein
MKKKLISAAKYLKRLVKHGPKAAKRAIQLERQLDKLNDSYNALNAVVVTLQKAGKLDEAMAATIELQKIKDKIDPIVTELRKLD